MSSSRHLLKSGKHIFNFNQGHLMPRHSKFIRLGKLLQRSWMKKTTLCLIQQFILLDLIDVSICRNLKSTRTTFWPLGGCSESCLFHHAYTYCPERDKKQGQAREHVPFLIPDSRRRPQYWAIISQTFHQKRVWPTLYYKIQKRTASPDFLSKCSKPAITNVTNTAIKCLRCRFLFSRVWFRNCLPP